MKFKGKEYTEVKDRIIAFADEFPESTIETELLNVNQIVDTPTGESCNEYVIKAIVRPTLYNNQNGFMLVMQQSVITQDL